MASEPTTRTKQYWTNSPVVENIIDKIRTAVNKQSTFHKTSKDALLDLSNNSLDFSLFETPLVKDPKTNRFYNLHSLRDADIIVGFIADTDASLTLYTNRKENTVTLKKGEIKMAWDNESLNRFIYTNYNKKPDNSINPTVIPLNIVHDNIWIEDVIGNVRLISAHLNTEIRKSMYESSFFLDPEWVISCGSIKHIIEYTLSDICYKAKKQTTFNKSINDALIDLKVNQPLYSFFETPLLPSKDYPYTTSWIHNGDILVGFRADTDASFTMVFNDDTRIPYTLKAGEFQFALENKYTLPDIRIYTSMKIENIKGDIHYINACLNSQRSTFQYICNLYIGPRWISYHWAFFETDHKYDMGCCECGDRELLRKEGRLCITHP